MIRETVNDIALNRLLIHFGSRVHVRPPASTAELAHLESELGPLPRDLVIFLTTCNGLRVELDAPEWAAHCCCIHELDELLRQTVASAVGPALLPLRDLPDGQRDGLVIEPGPAHGRVLRCDRWTPDVRLIASSFGRYFGAWVEYLIQRFDPSGRPRGRSHLAFDEEFIAGCDPDLAAVQADPRVTAWLARVQNLVPSGADFE